ncbi:MAG: DUF4139 domain-containing protein [Polyangiaceae bacterium]|nr:DUF4139 domain-containing protein [Polyangiaceae bacterium]
MGAGAALAYAAPPGPPACGAPPGGFGPPPPAPAYIAAQAAPPPPPPMAPAPAARSASASRKMAAPRPAAPQAEMTMGAPRDEPEAASSLRSPSFSALALPASDDVGGRTRLRVEAPAERYAAGLAGLGLRVSFDVMDTVRRAAEAAAAVASLALPPGAADVRRAAGHFDYAYPCDAPVDVPSDGAFHAVPVCSRRAQSDVLYVVVPREDTSVFREAEVQNPDQAPLLPGPAEIYVAGDYVLGTALPVVAPLGKVKLGLGVEQAIKCARNTRFHEERSGSKVVATAELVHDIDIELVNHLERPIRCEVRERIPQPAPGAEVVVEELRIEPPWEKYEQTDRGTRALEGGRRWLLSLAAGARATLSARYGVKIYANNEISGGNRREL